MGKSVLHIRIDSPFYSSNGIMKGFIENGYEYHFLLWQDYRFNNGVEATRKKVIEMANDISPELIFIHVQNEEIIDLETVIALQYKSFVINYTFDVRDVEGTKWVYKLAPHIGLTVFACQEDVDYCVNEGISNTMHVHSSCDMDLYTPFDSNKDKNEGGADIVFIGNNYENTNLNFECSSERVAMVSFLQMNYKDKFKVSGMNWMYSQLVGAKEEREIYISSKIAISQSNFNRSDYTSDRLWRIMATGTFCLSKYFKGIEKLFIRGVDLDWWNDAEELKEKIDFYLWHKYRTADIARMGMNKVRQYHTWANRIKEIEEAIKLN